MYAAVQKNDHGFDILDSRLKRMMSQNGVTPDLWILPQGIKIYLALARPENTVYALKGPDGQDVYKSALNGQNGVFMDAQNNCKVSPATQSPSLFETDVLFFRLSRPRASSCPATRATSTTRSSATSPSESTTS